MARNREKNRELVRSSRNYIVIETINGQERLDAKNIWGISDPTPRQAVDNIARRSGK
jgi:hypothetical protein